MLLTVKSEEGDDWGMWSAEGLRATAAVGGSSSSSGRQQPQPQQLQQSSSGRQQPQPQQLQQLEGFVPKSLLRFRECPQPAVSMSWAAPHVWLGSFLDLNARLEYFIVKPNG